MKGCLQVVGILIIGIFIIGLIGSSVDGEPEDQRTDSYALIYAEKAIKSKLKAPSTADFPGIRGAEINREGDTFYVISYVDSQNGFGAMIRSYWEVRVEFIEDKVRTRILSFE
ncbi:hypothetical protein FHG64_16095 [Antarcticibacterium flavum]|uniref:Uncharacterized protein n=1 Tax=Antarcticibacterium flavum TaxID=2058175 RepID=A0A5B7X6L5_9FLAO|nr:MULTISPECIES: hypothetical protein [Antarcticibacterium]MCM4159537.1 hypothetical protein [Antarcticibacterium sp. W02-3]QCY70790.1 hypothetical protein FHG64_16095 [Antarcticibacterium flavum]